MPNPVDESRLNDASRGAQVFDLDAYRARAEQTFSGATPAALNLRRAQIPLWAWAAVIIGLLMFFGFLRRA